MKKLMIVLALFALVAPVVKAELSVQPGRTGQIYYATPGGKIWSPVRMTGNGNRILNPDGDLRGDGVPSFGVNPVTEKPEAVWARFQGDTEIVYSEFDGEGWSLPREVSLYSGNDVLPTLTHNERGDRLIVWTRVSGTVETWFTASGVAARKFATPAMISVPQLPARSPALLADGTRALVAYEEERSDGRYIVVVAAELADLGSRIIRGNGGPIINPFQLGDVPSDAPAGEDPSNQKGTGGKNGGAGIPPPGSVTSSLDPVGPSRPLLHSGSGHVWVDWIAGPSVGYLEIRGNVLLTPGYIPIQGGGVEQARREAAREVTR